MAPGQSSRGRGGGFAGSGRKHQRTNNSMNGANRSNNGNGAYPQQPYHMQPYFPPYTQNGMFPHIPGQMHHQAPLGQPMGPPPATMGGKGKHRQESNNQRVIYTEMPQYAYNPAMVPPPGSYGNGNPPHNWRQNESQGARSSSSDSARKSSNAFTDSEDQHSNAGPAAGPTHPMEMVTISRAHYDSLVNEVHHLRSVVYNYQHGHHYYAPPQYGHPHHGYAHHGYPQQPHMANGDSGYSCSHSPERRDGTQDEDDQKTPKAKPTVAKSSSSNAQSDASPTDSSDTDIAQVVKQATEKTLSRNPNATIRRISYPPPAHKPLKFDGRVKSSFNTIMGDRGSRSPSPLPVRGISKISPVPTYEQLHATHRKNTSRKNSTQSDFLTVEPEKDAFAEQLDEVSELLNSPASSKGELHKETKVAASQAQSATIKEHEPVSASSEVKANGASSTGDTSTVVETQLSAAVEHGGETPTPTGAIAASQPRNASKPFKFNPQASDFSAPHTVENPQDNGSCMDDYVYDSLLSFAPDGSIIDHGYDDSPYGQQRRIDRGFPVFLPVDAGPSPAHNIEIAVTESFPNNEAIPTITKEQTEEPLNVMSADKSVGEPAEIKTPGKFSTSLSWADDLSGDEELVQPPSAMKTMEVELTISTGGPENAAVETPHIGAQDVQWIHSDDEKDRSGESSDFDQGEDTLTVNTPVDAKSPIGLGIPMIGVSDTEQSAKSTTKESDNEKMRKASNKSNASQASFQTAVENGTSGNATPENFRSAPGTPEPPTTISYSDKVKGSTKSSPTSDKKSATADVKVAAAEGPTASTESSRVGSPKTRDEKSPPKEQPLTPPKDEWTTVTKAKKKPGSGNSPAVTSAKARSTKGGSWATIANSTSASSGKVTPARSEAGATSNDKLPDLGRPLAHPRSFYRKLYITGIPKTVTYESFVSLIRGGLIDDIYISGLSPDYARHNKQADVAARAWFGYITFYSAMGAKRFIDYLNAIDPPGQKKVSDRFTVAHITIDGERLPVQLRDHDQREILPDIIEAVQKDKATRVLTFNFRRGISRGIRRPSGIPETKIHKSDGPVHWDWAVWKKAITTDNGKAAIDRIKVQIQVWGSSPVIYYESIKFLPTVKDPKTGDEIYRIQVSFLRISSAEKVKSHLAWHRDYVDNCLLTYGPDPCAMRSLDVPKPVHAVVVGTSNVAPSTDKPAVTKSRKKKKTPGNVNDEQVFPCLPGGATKESNTGGWKVSDKIKQAPSPEMASLIAEKPRAPPSTPANESTSKTKGNNNNGFKPKTDPKPVPFKKAITSSSTPSKGG